MAVSQQSPTTTTTYGSDVFNDAAQQQVKSITYGARALMRALPVNTGRIESFTMTEPGRLSHLFQYTSTIHKKHKMQLLM